MPFYEAKLSFSQNGGCNLHRLEAPVQETACPKTKEGAWHSLEVSLNDDVLRLCVNGEERICFRDPFPAPYEKRCTLWFHTWKSRLSLRNARIEDLGFLPYGRTIRQADALYNSGLFGQAQQLYQRMLETEKNPADMAELHCKLALCALEKNELARAYDWAQKVPAVPIHDLWAHRAAMVLLETDWHDGKIDRMLQRIEILAKNPLLRIQLNGVVQKAAFDLDSRGFYDEALQLRNSLFNMEAENSQRYFENHTLVCQSLFLLNRLENAATQFRVLVERCRAHGYANEYLLFTLIDILNALGRSQEGRAVIKEIRKTFPNELTHARCDIYEAFCLRAEGHLNRALHILHSVPQKYPKAAAQSVFAKLSAGLILVSQRKPNEAFALIEEVAGTKEYLAQDYSSRYRYPPLLIKGEFGKAAELLLHDSRADESNLVVHARQATQAALISAISDDIKGCQGILEEIVRRFPETRVRHFSVLAGILEKGIQNIQDPQQAKAIFDGLLAMPYPIHVRTEFFYLAGRMLVKMGVADSGKALLARCVEEDRSNLWPTVLAKNEVR